MAIRVLLVTDGTRFRFGPANPADEEFTLETLIGSLTNHPSPAIQVDTAHRRADAVATFPNFNFATTIADLSVYDEIWMIADEGAGSGSAISSAIGDDEAFKIAEFMDNGGGVFAVGDHAGIGSLMCGTLPRVRSMRKWYATGPDANYPVSGPDRADTIQPAPNGYFSTTSPTTSRRRSPMCRPRTRSCNRRAVRSPNSRITCTKAGRSTDR
jgi:hypothetical protein